MDAVRDDPVVTRWSGLVAESTDAWLARQERRAEASFAITVPPDDTALGKVGVRDGELSYWVVPDARGRGLAAAACRVLLDHLGLDEAVLDIEEDNPASQAVARRLGATPGRRHTEIDRAGVERRLVVWTWRR